jgi:hypothetical protein
VDDLVMRNATPVVVSGLPGVTERMTKGPHDLISDHRFMA